MIDDEMIEDRAKIYSSKTIPVHITKNDGEWLNGFIEEVSIDFLMLKEFKKGLMPVFFSEIRNIETYTREVEE